MRTGAATQMGHAMRDPTPAGNVAMAGRTLRVGETTQVGVVGRGWGAGPEHPGVRARRRMRRAEPTGAAGFVATAAPRGWPVPLPSIYYDPRRPRRRRGRPGRRVHFAAHIEHIN